MSQLRYVILRHEGIPEPHYDVMFEWRPDSELITLRSRDWPIATSTPLQRLADHRRIYLDYEGPLSGDRGHVRRIAEGTCKTAVDHDDALLVEFDSGVKIKVPPRAA